MKSKSESFKKVEEELKPDAEEMYKKGLSQALAFMLAIPGRLDAQARLLAKKLHDDGDIYIAYSVTDAFNLSISNLKLFWDLLLTNSSRNSADALHDWLLTPVGISIAITESISLIALSVMGNYFDEKDKNWFKSAVATYWPYLRDVMKALKNAYKGIRSLLQIANVLDNSKAFNFLILPMGLSFGILAALNRIWYRHMLSIRKESMRLNAKYLDMIQDRKDLAANEIEEFRAAVRRQTTRVRVMALMAATYGGIIDSLYLYLGVMSLCPLSIPAFAIMTAFSLIYCVTCVATRLYEEYDYQRKLVITQAKIELALYTQEYRDILTQKFAELEPLTLEISKRSSAYLGSLAKRALGDTELDALSADEKQHLEEYTQPREKHNYKEFKEQHEALTSEIYEILKGFAERRQRLQDLVLLSDSSAFLAGLKNGLAAYGAVASMVFSAATFLTLASVPFPPLLVIAFVSSGLALLIGFVAYTMYANYKHRIQQTPEKRDPYSRLSDFLKNCTDLQDPEKMSAQEEVAAVLAEGLLLDPSPQQPFQEWFEVVRAANPNKGLKATDFILNPLQDVDKNGHYHDTPLMVGLGVVSSVVHSLILGGRALARGFGRDAIDAVSKKDSQDIEMQNMAGKGQDYPPFDDYEEDKTYDEAEVKDLKEQPSPTSKQGSGRPVERHPDSRNNFHRRSTSMFSLSSHPESDISISRPSQDDAVSIKALNSPRSRGIFSRSDNSKPTDSSRLTYAAGTSIISSDTSMGLM
ncbi:hypothetical protein B1207_05290 [Legionella quinlivanii]|uniref:Transmembrane protein n=1 Tax=Legionella quinlivanii TaxID=45073 RepID=A0A364LLH8_9GAMM|nr:hypothetical protein [Legionella quinlivanii]RAP37587.1 hypothetical protein B1207_05290 [Legionella quinlivanii]